MRGADRVPSADSRRGDATGDAAAGLQDGQTRFLVNMCSGLPGLAEAALRGLEGIGEDQAGARAAVTSSVSCTLVEAVRQLGVAGIVALDDLTSKDVWEFSEGSVDPLILEAFRGAGFAQQVGGTANVSVLNSRMR